MGQDKQQAGLKWWPLTQRQQKPFAGSAFFPFHSGVREMPSGNVGTQFFQPFLEYAIVGGGVSH